MAEIYFSGQGVVYAATRNTNGTVNANAFRDLGNIPSLSLNLETDVLEHKESRTGSRLLDLRIVRDRKATITMTLESFSKKNLMMLLYGSSQSVAGATISGGGAEVFPTVAIGDVVALANTNLTSFTSLVDSAGSPLTLTQGTHYTVDLSGGMVTILAIPGTQPYKASYVHATKDVVPMFEANQEERFLRFSGLNTANANKGAVVELYRVVFDPVSNFDLITDELGQYELTGSVLYDDTRDLDATLGGFGRIIQT